MSTDEKDGDPSDGKKNPPPMQVVITHYGKKKKESEEEIPSEIMPATPSHIVSSPVDIGASAPDAPKPSPKAHVIPPKVESIIPVTSQPFVGKSIPPVSSQKSKLAQGPTATLPPEEEPPMTTASVPPSADNESKKSGSGLGGVINFLIIISVAGLIYFAYSSSEQLNALQTQIRNDQTAVVALTTKAKQHFAELEKIQSQNETEKRSLKALKMQIESAQSQYVSLTGSNDWALSEANYLVFMANERLKTAQDVPTALTQLEAADQRLNTLGNPALAWVREILAKDIAKLQSLPNVNKHVIWEEVGLLIPAFYQLHFKTVSNSVAKTEKAESTVDKNAPYWQKALWHSWQELKDIIRVQPEEENPIPATLTTENQLELLRTMQLLCGQAQWAVLQGDNKIYQSSLRSLQTLVEKYFRNDEEQITMIKQLQQLQQQAVAVQIADLSGSLNALSKALLESKQKPERKNE